VPTVEAVAIEAVRRHVILSHNSHNPH
jgi:hypothetical protein